MSDLITWLQSGKHLPEKLRDFHDQKDFFKSMHFLQDGNKGCDNNPTWMNGHIYIIDFFLWFMASLGYTLQKTRKKNIDFNEWPNYRELLNAENEDI